MFFVGEVAGILHLAGQQRVVQQGAQGGQGGRLDRGRYAWWRFVTLLPWLATLAVLVPGLVAPLLLASALVRLPLLFLMNGGEVVLRHVAVVGGVAGHGVVVVARVVVRHAAGGRGVLRQLLDLLRVEAGDFLQAVAHQLAQVGAGDLFDQRCGQGRHVRLAFQRARVGFDA
ncbi:hypothetical protein D3C81_593510 [compost metagenome]